MSLTEREKEIALECHKELRQSDFIVRPERLCDLFLSRIREEQEASGVIEDYGYRLGSYVRLLQGELPTGTKLFTTPPAAPCDNGSKQDCNCSELVETLKKMSNAVDNLGYCEGGQEGRVHLENMTEYADKALANHAKRMKGGE